MPFYKRVTLLFTHPHALFFAPQRINKRLRRMSSLVLREPQPFSRTLDGEVASATCCACGQEAVGAGFSNRFFVLHVVVENSDDTKLVPLCDTCDHVHEPDTGTSVIVGVTRGVVDLVCREND